MTATRSQALAAYPAELATSWSPIYGQAVTIRPIRPDDAALELAFLNRLSPETRYNRFLGAGVRPTAAMVEKFTCIDYHEHMAFIATLMLDGEETQIGVARYIRLPDGTGEFAIVIEDGWQGCGVGRRLLEQLMEHARAEGVTALVGDVLAGNKPMLSFVKHLGFEADAHPETRDLRRVTRQLGAPLPA